MAEKKKSGAAGRLARRKANKKNAADKRMLAKVKKRIGKKENRQDNSQRFKNST